MVTCQGDVDVYSSCNKQLTWSPHILEEAEDAVDGCVGEDERVVCVEEDLEDIEHGGHVALPSLVHLLVGRVLNLDGAQRTEQWAPARLDLTRARLNQLTDRTHNLK